MLELKLFGTGQASYCGQPLPGFPRKQPYLLLCYLVVNRHHSYPREQLAAVFWGDYPTPTSRKQLRNSLWRVRQLLASVGTPADKYLTIDEDRVAFSCSSQYSLDIEAFEAAVMSCQRVSGQKLTPEEAAQLEKAIDLYTDDLLVGIYEDWCLYERERLSLQYLNTLGKLMAYHEINGNYEHGLIYGQRILACDNTREAVHRQMMRLHWHSGDRNAALVQYKLCAQILHETLGIVPLPETTRLYQKMKAGRLNPEVQPQHHVAPVPTSIGPDAAVPVLVEQALDRLHILRASVEQVHAEINQIEDQLLGILAASWEAQSPIPNPTAGSGLAPQVSRKDVGMNSERRHRDAK